MASLVALRRLDTSPCRTFLSGYCELYQRWNRNHVVLRQERRAAEKLFVDCARRFPSVISEWAKSRRQLRRQKFIAGREFGACRHNLAARRKSIAPSPDIFPNRRPTTGSLRVP